MLGCLIGAMLYLAGLVWLLKDWCCGPSWVPQPKACRIACSAELPWSFCPCALSGSPVHPADPCHFVCSGGDTLPPGPWPWAPASWSAGTAWKWGDGLGSCQDLGTSQHNWETILDFSILNVMQLFGTCIPPVFWRWWDWYHPLGAGGDGRAWCWLTLVRGALRTFSSLRLVTRKELAEKAQTLSEWQKKWSLFWGDHKLLITVSAIRGFFICAPIKQGEEKAPSFTVVDWCDFCGTCKGKLAWSLFLLQHSYVFSYEGMMKLQVLGWTCYRNCQF